MIKMVRVIIQILLIICVTGFSVAPLALNGNITFSILQDDL